MQSHSLAHIRRIHDTRTYHFPPSVGFAQARPNNLKTLNDTLAAYT